MLCFPYIFRGALDVGATTINEPMKRAAVEAIAALAREAPSEVAARPMAARRRISGRFAHSQSVRSAADPADRTGGGAGRDRIGEATRPFGDFDGLSRAAQPFVFRSGFGDEAGLRPREGSPKRVIYAEGEDERVLRATQVSRRRGLAHPLLIGRPQVIETRLERYGCRSVRAADFTLINPDDDPRYREYVAGLC